MELRHDGRPDPTTFPTVKELIDRIMADAEYLIRKRLAGFLDGNYIAATPRKKVA